MQLSQKEHFEILSNAPLTYSTRIVPFGILHLNMNLEHFCTSLSALFDMYSLDLA